MHGLPENEPVSLVITFERDNVGYIDIFREYIGGREHPDLLDRNLLKDYLQHQGKSDAIFSDVSTYTPQFFRGYIEKSESQTDTRQIHIAELRQRLHTENKDPQAASSQNVSYIEEFRQICQARKKMKTPGWRQ